MVEIHIHIIGDAEELEAGKITPGSVTIAIKRMDDP